MTEFASVGPGDKRVHRAETALDAPRTPGAAFTVVVVCAAAVIWVWSYQTGVYAARFTAVPVSLAVFLAVQIGVPRARWSRDRVLGPGNVALIIFAIQLVVIPTILTVSGPAPGVLDVLPADRYINQGLLLQALAYVCYAIGYFVYSRPVRAVRLLPEAGTTTTIAIAFLAVGVLGLALAFPSIGDLRDYFAGQGDIFVVPGSATLGEAAGTFLRPFLAYGLIILWAARIARHRPGRPRPLVPIGLGLAVLAVAVSATYGYNRASVVIPILAMLTAYSAFRRRLRLYQVAAVLALLATLTYQFGVYRGEYTATLGGRLSTTEAAELGQPGRSFSDDLQLYANGAQFWATVVQDVDRAGLREGDTLPGSVLLPVPIIGKPFRAGAESGPSAYNELVYGKAGTYDQILGFGAELYWNFGVPALVVGYLLLGFVVRRFDDRVEGAVDPLAAYSWTYCGIWVALLTINSLSVLSQIIVYFFWPIIAMTFLARLTSLRASEVHR